MTLGEALLEGRRRIAALGSDEAELEAEILLRHALSIDRAHLYARLQDLLTEQQREGYERLIARREAYEPTPYITGHREFYGLGFEVTPAALIPRPETETLLDLALAFAREHGGTITIVDVGAGAGTIAIPLARELANARVIATDTSEEALELARRNAERYSVADRIDFRYGDLLEPVAEPIDLIVSNPPYVTTEQWEAMPPEIREWEPRQALDGGRDGLDFVRRLLTDAPAKLAPGGALFCEIGDWQGAEALALATTAFPGAAVDVLQDLAGRDRVLVVAISERR